jgi:purine nucleosidase/pyrimidine-specific ribonucleoside hydrolase
MRRKVLIDTDPGVDDLLALVLAMSSPELEVLAICTVCGNVSVERATRNAHRLLEMLSPKPLPVLAVGAGCPIGREPVNAQAVHGSDGVGDLWRFEREDGTPRYPDPPLPASLPTALEIYRNLTRSHKGEVTLVCLGPVTNLALFLMAYGKETQGAFREVIIMGGAIKCAGNITPSAEFNVFADPHAAQWALNSGLPILFIPLDVTERVLITREEMEEISRMRGDPVGDLLRDASSKVFSFMEERTGEAIFYLHDPLAVGVAVDPSVVKAVPLHVEVETRGEATLGRTVADLRPIKDEWKAVPNAKVALEVDSAKFKALFRERVCRARSS